MLADVAGNAQNRGSTLQFELLPNGQHDLDDRVEHEVDL